MRDNSAADKGIQIINSKEVLFSPISICLVCYKQD